MATRGFWGLIKNGEEKMIYNHFDSYPDELGKDVVFLILNNRDSLEKIFEKIILVKNLDNLDESEEKFILINPRDLVSKHIEEKYFSESAKAAFEGNALEYGYMIDLDKSVLKLYDGKTKIAEIDLNTIKYKDVKQAFDAQ